MSGDTFNAPKIFRRVATPGFLTALGSTAMGANEDMQAIAIILIVIVISIITIAEIIIRTAEDGIAWRNAPLEQATTEPKTSQYGEYSEPVTIVTGDTEEFSTEIVGETTIYVNKRG
jgi:hypothetical protein